MTDQDIEKVADEDSEYWYQKKQMPKVNKSAFIRGAKWARG